jgi:hypothetical protein
MGVIMLKETLMIAFCLILFPSSHLLAGTNHSMADANAAGLTDTQPVSTIQIYANADGTKEMVACTEPRPQVCSQDYQPVCAVMQDGSFKTYSNGCSACSDPEVNSYREGACE